MVRVVKTQAPNDLRLFARERREKRLNCQDVARNARGRVKGRPRDLISSDGLFVPCGKANCMST